MKAHQSAGRSLLGFVVKATLKVAEQESLVEESPGSMLTRWRLTAARGNPRDSATENKPPAFAARAASVWSG